MVVVVEITFNKNFARNITFPLLSSDIYWKFGSPEDESFLEPQPFNIQAPNILSSSIRPKKPFAVPRTLLIIVPSESRLRAENRMRLNEFDNQTLTLTEVSIDKILNPQIQGGSSR